MQKRTIQNYKFGIVSDQCACATYCLLFVVVVIVFDSGGPQFSIILQELFESYNSMVSIGTVDELCRTVLAWFEQNCTLPSLRPSKKKTSPNSSTKLNSSISWIQIMYRRCSANVV